MITLWSLLKAGLLVLNGATILHRGRFLKKVGLDAVDESLGVTSLKNQAAGLLQAVTYMKAPLIAANTLVIVVELLFG